MDPELKRLAERLAKLVEQELPGVYGFVLLLSKFDTGGTDIVMNVPKREAVRVMRLAANRIDPN